VIGRETPDTGRLLEHLWMFEAGQTPPFVLAWLAAFWSGNLGWLTRQREPIELSVMSVVGLATWAGLAALFWFAALARFRKLTNRTRRMTPDLLQPGPRAVRRPVPVRRPKHDLPLALPAGEDGVSEAGSGGAT
jgi:hypothetical protein